MTWSGLWRLRQKNILVPGLNILYGVTPAGCVKLQLGLSLCKRPDGRGVFDFDHDVGMQRKVQKLTKETGIFLVFFFFFFFFFFLFVCFLNFFLFLFLFFQIGEEAVTAWLMDVCPSVGAMDIEERRALSISKGLFRELFVFGVLE